MNILNLKEIIDCTYSDFDRYLGKFSEKEKKLFLKYLKELKIEVEDK